MNDLEYHINKAEMNGKRKMGIIHQQLQNSTVTKTEAVNILHDAIKETYLDAHICIWISTKCYKKMERLVEIKKMEHS